MALTCEGRDPAAAPAAVPVVQHGICWYIDNERGAASAPEAPGVQTLACTGAGLRPPH